MLGGAWAESLESQGKKVQQVGRDLFDLERPNADFLKRSSPTFFAHCAANTAVDACEDSPELAFRMNTAAVEVLGRALDPRRTTFVFISSTGIYGKANPSDPYSEYDEVRPTTVYHESKWRAEQWIRRHYANHLILRTGWLFGGRKEHRKNFVWKRIQESQGKTHLFGDPSQRGNPTYIPSLISTAERMISEGMRGTFNLVGDSSVTRLEYVAEIMRSAGQGVQVRAGDSSMFQRRAPVSPNESASNHKLKLSGLVFDSDWKKQMQNYIRTLQVEGT